MMNEKLNRINSKEVEFIYKSPLSLVDYSRIQSFSLIRSSIEVFAYYGIEDFTAEDIKQFFEKLQLLHHKKEAIFIPSVKKVTGVLDCCLGQGRNMLSCKDGSYHIVSWDSSGLGYELEAAKRTGKLVL